MTPHRRTACPCRANHRIDPVAEHDTHRVMAAPGERC